MADYYDDDESEDMGRGAPSDDESTGQTGLLPKSFFGDKPLDPGTICSVEIVKAYDDQVEVRYVPHDESDEPIEEEAIAEEAPADEMMM